MFDYLVVGAGFSGAVVAAQMARAISQARACWWTAALMSAATPTTIADQAGVLVHKYGPHIFHTNSKDVFDYLSQFTRGGTTSIACWHRWTENWCRFRSTSIPSTVSTG